MQAILFENVRDLPLVVMAMSMILILIRSHEG
jgi:hypothetical protein